MTQRELWFKALLTAICSKSRLDGASALEVAQFSVAVADAVTEQAKERGHLLGRLMPREDEEELLRP